MIVAFRIDERLIHGQIIATWLKTLGVTHLIVANDEVSCDISRQTALKMVLPSNVKCLIKSVDEVVTVLNDPRCESMRILLISGNPQDSCRLVERIPTIKEVNLANYGSITKPEIKSKINISPMVYLDQNDVDAVNQLINLGLKVFTQKTPSDHMKIITRI
ncbi:MAG: PTS sugar transporter subunit IIB [Erysipelotrichaceae bacterium]|nr:PTS sugar transporter subunit IIB [Erysipelotrichaceae bacterium]